MAAREVAHKIGLEPLYRSQVRTHVEGLDILERTEGPVIFVANHASHLDTPLILFSLPDEWRRRTAVAAAADYFFDTWWRAVGSSLLFNTFPIDRRGGSGRRTFASQRRKRSSSRPSSSCCSAGIASITSRATAIARSSSTAISSRASR